MVEWKLELFALKLLFAAFQMDLETGFAVLSTTDVANEHVWPMRL